MPLEPPYGFTFLLPSGCMLACGNMSVHMCPMPMFEMCAADFAVPRKGWGKHDGHTK